MVRCVLQLIAARCYQSVLISSSSAFGGGALFGNPRPCICVRRLPGVFGHLVVNCTECFGVGINSASACNNLELLIDGLFGIYCVMCYSNRTGRDCDRVTGKILSDDCAMLQ